MYGLGTTEQIECTVDPADATLEYSSSDENVATVSDTGLITSVDSGDTTITVTANKQGYYSTTQQFTLTVSPGA